jgi:glycyl-tRNA synthetase beta chain
MLDTRDLLIEIGTEELPPKSLVNLSLMFEIGICSGLKKAGLSAICVQSFATPRRLAMLIKDLPVRQADYQLERRGPTLSAAFGQDGLPTRAAEGFAQSCGVSSVAELRHYQTANGAWLTYSSIEPGASTSDLIPNIVEAALNELPIKKRMRWGNYEHAFIRPVRWVVLLFGEEVIPANIMGVRAGRETRGHRFHHPSPIFLTAPSSYARQLADEGKVIANFSDRRDTIKKQVENIALELNGIVVINPALLDEITSLVEWPVALACNFDRRFLEIPAEVLIDVMQDKQRYFHLVDNHEHLLPHFITITNLESSDPTQIRAGNERVIFSRFRDAEFFWDQDRKRPLAGYQEMLKDVVFQERLGSLTDKRDRLQKLSRVIATKIDGNPDWAERAAWLSKCDLLTQMVQEFTELQGIIGRYYALLDNEIVEVADAQEEQYLPRFAGDRLPSTSTGCALALADRLDNLIGIFAVGQQPSGAKDPFALRRAALGVLRILIEGKIDLDLQDILERTAAGFGPTLQANKVIKQVFIFIMERLRRYYIERGISPCVFEAVLECHPVSPLDFDQRINAIKVFQESPEVASLTAANKRICNILRKFGSASTSEIQHSLLIEYEERELTRQLIDVSSKVETLIKCGLYKEALYQLSNLIKPINDFFDKVLIISADCTLSNNRIALLNILRNLFLRIADFSRLSD